MYLKQVKENKRLRTIIEEQRKELDNHFAYIQKLTIVNQLLKDRIKEPKYSK